METANFNFNIATPGAKTSNATRPELVATPTYNNFRLNGLATDVMELEHADHVMIVEDTNQDWEGRFYIAASTPEYGAKVAAVNKKPGTGKTLTFTYSGVYSKIIQEDGSKPALSPDAMADKGLLDKRITKKGNTSYVSTKIVSWGLGDPMETEIPEIGEVTLYPLIDAKVKDYNPRGNEEVGEANMGVEE